MLTKLGFHDGRDDSRNCPTSSIGQIRRDFLPVSSDNSDMDSVADRIRRRLDELGLNAFEASRRAGFHRTFINDLLTGQKSGVRGANLSRLAMVLECSPSYLLGEVSEPGPRYAPIIGRVGADPEGRVLYAEGQATGDLAPIPIGLGKVVPLEVAGHSLKGFADNGSLIYIDDQHHQPTPDMLGNVVVAELDTGEVLIKRLLRGSQPGRYDLESIAGPTRHDVTIVWVALVAAILPPHSARRLIKRSEAA